MVITGLDTETTGFDALTGDRIVEVCVSLYDYDGTVLKPLRTITERFNPERPIPAEAQRVHGISYEDVKASPKWAEFAPKMDKILSRTELLVIHNAAFDVPFIEHEQKQAGYPVSRTPETFCTMVNGRWSTFDGKS
ncbi:3'-5' exonuclease [Xanthomonas phage JGB6]|nr:3'-5' exonuclease [Xanthomonas phage JGB6]